MSRTIHTSSDSAAEVRNNVRVLCTNAGVQLVSVATLAYGPDSWEIMAASPRGEAEALVGVLSTDGFTVISQANETSALYGEITITRAIAPDETDAR